MPARPEVRPNLGHVSNAMEEALKAAEEAFKPVFGNRAAIVINVATKDWAFGSKVDRRRRSAGVFRTLAASLRQSAEEADDA